MEDVKLPIYRIFNIPTLAVITSLLVLYLVSMSTKENNVRTLTEEEGASSQNASGAYGSTRSETSIMESQKIESQTTQFANDAEVVIAKVAAPKMLARELLKSAEISKVQDIKDFLAKPYPYLTGNLQSTDVAGTFSAIQVPSSILSTDIYYQKLKGHLGFKADLILRLQVNANRFQQGRYILFYIPGSFGSTQNYTSYFNMRACSLTTVTQLPHVEIDIACDTEAILKIPYTSWSTHWSILDQSTVTNCGTVQLRPYVPLASNGGSTTAEFTLWTYFENIEIVAPTLAQMDMQIKKSKKPPTEVEQKNEKIGPITAGARKLQKTTTAVSKIPVLSEFASVATWALDIVADVASIWGWSNPIDLSHTMRMVQTIFPFSNNVDSADESMPLSFYARNAVDIMESNGSTSLDETSLSYIAGIPAFYKKVNISTSDDYNTLLWSESLTPINFYQQFTEAGVPSFRTYTPLGYLSKMFGSWRGSIGFRFKFVKTEFHSARFVLSFAPYQTTHSTWNVTDTPYLFREIIDLRYGNEFTVVIPYSSLKPYRNSNSSEPYGTVCLHVLNELKAPGTVPSTINLLIEPFGCQDFEFAVPRSILADPYAPVAVAQMDDNTESDGNACSITNTTIGGSTLTPDDLAPSRYCIGERFMSLNALLKHASSFRPTANFLSSVAIDFATRCINVGTTTGVYDDPILTADNFSYITAMFAYHRGSVRVRGVFDPSTPRVIATGLYRNDAGSAPQPSYSTSSAALGLLCDSNNPIVFQSSGFRAGFEVQVPFYNESFVIPNQWFLSIGSGSTIGTPSYTIPTQYISARCNSATTPLDLTRQVGDDFQLFGFCAVPPLAGTLY